MSVYEEVCVCLCVVEACVCVCMSIYRYGGVCSFYVSLCVSMCIRVCICRRIDFYIWVYGVCVCVCCIGEWICGISGLENHQLTNLCPLHPSALKQCKNFHKIS